MMENTKKIVIIGAGPAGLTAAWELVNGTKQRYEVIVLEASDTVGGMAKTVIHNDNIMDLGGHRFFSKEKRVLDWWKAALPDTEKEQSPLMIRDRVTSIYYNKRFFDYPVALNLQNMRKLGIKNSCMVAVDYLKSYTKPLEEDSLENFYINRFGKKMYSLFFEEYTQKLCGAHPKEISPKWGEHRVRGLSIEAIIKKDSNEKREQTKESLLSSSQFYYPKYGPGQLWEAVAKDVVSKGAQIRTGCQVTKIHRSEEGRIDSVTVQTPCGEEVIEGDIFISSMPMRELISNMNQVPSDIRTIAESIPYRAFVTVGFVVDKLAINVPDCWIYVQDERVKVCRIQFYDNWSPYLSKEHEGKTYIALEYFCEAGDSFWAMTEEDCCQYAIKEAILLGILHENAQVFDCRREQIPQAYPGYYGAYDEIDKIKDYLTGISNLFCIGRNGQHEYWNMDKCMLSAWDAVDKIKLL